MSSLDLRLAQSATVVYFTVIVILGLEAMVGRARLRFAWLAVLGAGAVVHAAALVARGVASGEVPFTDLFEYTLFMSLAIVVAYLLFFRKRLPTVGALVVVVVAFLLLGSAAFIFNRFAGLYRDPAGAIMPALKSNWLYIHVSLAALGETFFAVGFVSSLLYLARRRTAESEALDPLDRLTYKAITMGFPLFTAGAMVAGAIWAKQAWGAYWSWDPKEVLSLVVWLVYAIYLHARLVRGLRGAPLAVISIVGFTLTIFTIFGTVVFGGLHSYG
jgi:ABC-type transport system involved in cytochrome c biogenesis permease subunit